jgi:non-ribosomal peptide synthase protein (TIGR01720 family)
LVSLQNRHPALNSRFEIVDDEWRQVIVEPFDRGFITSVDLSDVPEPEVLSLFEKLADEAQRSLHLSRGPLLRALLCSFPNDLRARLFITIHHLVVDWVSWRILAADLEAAANQIGQGSPVSPASAGTSFKEWAELLTRFATSAILREETPYWCESSLNQAFRLKAGLHASPDAERREDVFPLQTLDGINDAGCESRYEVSIDSAISKLLIQEAPGAHSARVQDILLAALLNAWNELTGAESLLLDFDSHGRPESFQDTDLSGTVGWFTSVYPIYLSLPQGLHAVNTVRNVRQQLELVRHNGIGYGVLRYLSPDAGMKDTLASLPAPKISFNYLGQFDQTLPQGSAFIAIGTRTGAYRNPAGRRSHLLDVQVSLLDRTLILELIYSEGVLQRETIERLGDLYADHLKQLLVAKPPQPGTALSAW